VVDDRRSRIGLDRFLTQHAASLREFDHFIEQDGIDIEVRVRKGVHVVGRLHCLGGTYLEVRVFLTLDERNQGRVRRYTYHAGIKREGDFAIFRYDNAHSYMREGQPDAHHKHRFDVMTGREIVPPEWIGSDRAPTLSSVLAELEQWWLETGQFLEPSQ
jgi:uncharacterized protein DUF6516